LGYSKNAIEKYINWLIKEKILAIIGLRKFHFSGDAKNHEATSSLRTISSERQTFCDDCSDEVIPMCLGIPGKVVEIEKNVAKVNVGGFLREISLDLCPDVSIGEYVLIHTGFAIQKS